MFSDLSTKLKQLHDEPDTRKSLDVAIEAANEVIKILSPAATNLQYGEDALDKAVPASVFPNHKIENWFAGHPYFADDRVALKFYENDQVETHFYWLGESATKARIAAGTAITPNWEDSELNQKDDSYKVGLDFFLSHDAKSLLVVATNKNNLRVLELERKLSNTQIDIFKTIRGAFDLTGRQQIHQTIWDSLALSEVNKNFYKGIAEHFAILINHFTAENYDKEDSKLFTSRLLGRLLFVWFLRKKNIIDESFGYFDIEGVSSTEYYEKSLKKLFFHTLNTPVSDASREDKVTPYLNGGLFEAHDNDWADRTVSFPTGYFKSLFKHLEQYNFTTDESSPEYEQVAIDPEMLGRVFESLLATQLTETGDQARKAKGAFYTPREIVGYMSRESLRQYLYTKLNNSAWNEGVDKLLDTSDSEWELSHSNSKRNLWGEANRNIVPQMVITALDDLKVLDPACGSGAYPMGMLQVILKTYERLESRFDPYATKLRIIEENIYGVDIEPMAVEISRLRAWLSIVVDSNKNPSEFKPLPNLDFKFVVANSLLPLSKDFQLGDDKYDKIRSKMQWVIGKYFNTTDKQEKANLRTDFNKASSSLGQTSLLDIETQLQKQLHSFRPFDVHSEAAFFDPKLMFGLRSRSPFDIVIGNPPYVGEKGNRSLFETLKKSSFGEKFYKRKMDLFYFFFHMGLDVLANEGILAYITTNYYPTADGAIKLRKDFFDRTDIVRLINLGEITVFDSARGQHNLITILQRKNTPSDRYETEQITVRSKGSVDSGALSDILNGYSDVVSVSRLNKRQVYDNIGSDFYIRFAGHSSGTDELLDKIKASEKTLKDFADINMGVQTGADRIGKSLLNKYKQQGGAIDYSVGENIYLLDDISSFSDDEINDVLRKYIKGSSVSRYAVDLSKHEWIIYADSQIDIAKYPNILAHLQKYRHILAYREQVNNSDTTWFRIRGAKRKYFVDTGRHIVTPYRSKTNRFAITDGCTYGAGDIYLLTNINEDDIDYLLAILNSKLVYFWLYHRGKRKGDMLEFYQTPLSQIPIASSTSMQKVAISKIVKEVIEAKTVDLASDTSALESQIDQLVYQIYNLTPDEIEIIEIA